MDAESEGHQVLKSRDGGPDARIIGDLLALVERDVEVSAHLKPQPPLLLDVYQHAQARTLKF